MEFKFSTFAGTLMLITIMCIVSINCSIINTSDYDDDSENNFYNGVPVYTRSRECSMAGGICVQEGDCQVGELAQKPGLCLNPQTGLREIGVECCYEVIPREAPCRQFGGTCLENCSPSVRQLMGNDCGDKICCILVN